MKNQRIMLHEKLKFWPWPHPSALVKKWFPRSCGIWWSFCPVTFAV